MALKARSALLFWLVLAAVVGATFLTTLLWNTFIGLDNSGFPLGEPMDALAKLIAPTVPNSLAGFAMVVLVLLGMGAGAFAMVRAGVRQRVSQPDAGRRGFLTGTASGAGAGLLVMLTGFATAAARTFLGVGNQGRGWGSVGPQIFTAEVEKTYPEWPDAWKGAQVQSYRRFGRTGFEISDIVLGTARIRGDAEVDVVRAVLDRGVNYIDTAPDYSAAGSEEAVGKAIQGRRDGLFIATKFCTTVGHLPTGTPVSVYKNILEGSLTRLGTDYVDLVHIHSCDELDRLMDPNVHEAFDRLKQEGKVRFLGFSSHTPNLEDVANRSIESGRFDVMMLAYHHGLWGNQKQIIERARREQDMGIVAMKTLKGAKHDGLADFREQAPAFSQAALRWTLSNPDVSAAIISFFEMQHVDEYLMASGSGPSAEDLAILERYDQLIAGSYCAPHCGECLDSCPEGLPIDDVLRYRMYFEDYGWEKEGLQHYARLGSNASVCASCSAPCAGSCPLGLDIKERMRGAHDLLSLV